MKWFIIGGILLTFSCTSSEGFTPFSKHVYANEKTSEVFIIKQKFNVGHVKDSLMLNCSISDIKDSTLLVGVEELENARFKVDILYLKDENILLGVGSSWYVVRYVYNPKLSVDILNGFSSELSEEEKLRLSNKFHRMMKDYN